MPDIGSGERRTRADIQALRGYAVAIVILFHANIGIYSAGFLGVDVFFVVSGYLIAGIIMRELGERRFSFQDFYLRRVRRLFPAAFVTLATTIIGSALFLTSTGWERFAHQIYGSLLFSTNIVLWKQINYFHHSADLEPLLHMWSLAVEEQYYLLLPLALKLVPRRLWLPAIALLTIGSLAGFAWLYPRSPGAAFYLLPTRAWEIGIGALATFAKWSGPITKLRQAIAVAGVGALILLPFARLSVTLQPMLCLPATLATAAILVAWASPAGGIRAGLRPLTWLGDKSYSLYLLHWPLFSLAHNIYLSDELPLMVSLGLIATTLLIASMQFAWVEEPVRRRVMTSRQLWLMLIGGTAVLAAACAIGSIYKARVRTGPNLAGVTGLPFETCDTGVTPFVGTCAQSLAPTMLIWGDSISQAITPALDVSTTEPIAQASMGQCAPLPGIAPVDQDANAIFARACLDHNRSVLDYAMQTPSIKVVVMTGSYLRYAQPMTRVLTDAPGAVPVVPSVGTIVAAQARATNALRAAGKRVVVITPPPQANFDVGQCWERRLQGRLVLGRPHDCRIVPADRNPDERGTAAMFAAFVKGGTPVIRLDRLLCATGSCATSRGDVILYRDSTHLSKAGTVLVGREFSLGTLADQIAR